MKPPADGVGDVLGRDRVEELAPHRKAQLQDVEDQLSGKPKALAYVEATVEVRIVDEPLPADGRPGLPK